MIHAMACVVVVECDDCGTRESVYIDPNFHDHCIETNWELKELDWLIVSETDDELEGLEHYCPLCREDYEEERAREF